MNLLLHKQATGAISVLLLFVLVIGCGAACAQTMKMKSHACCDSKGSCKSHSSGMKSGGCERETASVPGTMTVTLDVVTTPVVDDNTHLIASVTPSVHNAPLPLLIPLRI